MPAADFLGNFLRNFIQNTAHPALREITAKAIGGNEGWAQNQENQRQAAQLAQQLNLHNSLTPYEAQSLALSSSGQAAATDRSAEEQQLNLAKLLGGGGFKEATGDDPGSISYGGKKISVVPPEAQAGNFSFKPTEQDVTNYPWLGQYKDKGLLMPAKEFPSFMSDMQKLEKNNPQSQEAYKQTLLTQLDQLVPDPSDPMKAFYRAQIQDALQPGDGSAPDHKRAVQWITDLAKDQQAVATEKRKQALQFSPEAIAGQSKLSYAKAGAEADAQAAASARNLPDSTLKYWWEQVKRGAINYQDVLSRFDKAGKERMANYVAKLGDPAPIALSVDAQKRLGNLDPVLHSLYDLKEKVDQLPPSNTPGSFSVNRALYGMGAGTPDSGLLSQAEMDNLRGAAQAMPGGMTAVRTLEQAQLHTPQVWKDSTNLVKDKLKTMIEYLEDQKLSLEKYGTRSGVTQTGAQAPGGGLQINFPTYAPAVKTTETNPSIKTPVTNQTPAPKEVPPPDLVNKLQENQEAESPSGAIWVKRRGRLELK